jgi:hypothetical protein
MRSLRGLHSAHQVGLHLRIWVDGRECSGGKSNSKKMAAISVRLNPTAGPPAF